MGTHAAPTDAPRHRVRLAVAFAITAAVVVAQAVGAVVTGSLALLTDTAHLLADAAGLLVALVAATLALRPATTRRTWGFRRIEVVAALGQAVLLLAVALYAVVEGVSRLAAPPEVPSTALLVLGVVGLAGNAASIAVLASSRDANLNLRAAFLEVLGDALGSLAVIVAAVVIATTGYQRADALAGLAVAALVVPRAVRILREATAVLMEFTPRGLDLDDVRAHILAVDHVEDVHDLHASTVATGLPVLSAHVVVDDGCFRDGHALEIVEHVRACVAQHFPVSVEHSTFQLETAGLRDAEAHRHA
jgi:cobalt-zinc-cadmium efflux system protein